MKHAVVALAVVLAVLAGASERALALDPPPVTTPTVTLPEPPPLPLPTVSSPVPRPPTTVHTPPVRTPPVHPATPTSTSHTSAATSTASTASPPPAPPAGASAPLASASAAVAPRPAATGARPTSRRGTPVRSARAERRGIAVSFSLAGRERVRFVVTELAPVCRAVGSFAVTGRSGPNRIRLRPRVGARNLGPGTYRVVATTQTRALFAVQIVVARGR